MPKIYKRILTPLFFVVIALVVICCSAFADDITGIPYISINGNSPIPWISSVTFNSNDVVSVTSSGLITFSCNIPSDVTLIVNPNVTLRFGSYSLEVSGICDNYGTITRNNGSRTITVNSGGIFNSYYGSVVIVEANNAIYVNDDGIVNIYGGSIIGTPGIYNSSGSTINFYSGSVDGFYNSNDIIVSNGTLIEDNGTYTVKTNLLGVITDVVTSSVSWIGNFITAINSSYLLLAFVLIVFTGLGISILRRVKSI